MHLGWSNSVYFSKKIRAFLTIGILLSGSLFSALNADAQATSASLPGGVDPSFKANLFTNFNSQSGNVSVNLAARQPDGKTLLVGSFSYFNGVGRRNFVRLNADGSVDASFNPPVLSSINAIASLPDGKLLVGGSFSFALNSVTYSGLIRLNEDGSLDDTFAVAAGSVQAIAVLPDGKILVGGSFTQISGYNANQLARLYADGTLDISFQTGTGFDGGVLALAVQPDGKILAGGFFNSFNGTPRPRIARLNADGTLDAGFNPGTGANNAVTQIIVQPDGKILIAGDFNAFNGVTRPSRVARLEANGALDASFAPNVTVPGLFTTRIALQPDGKILAALRGSFLTGANATYLYRLNADGTTDTAFNPIVQSPVLTMLPEADGKILIGGAFAQVNGVPRTAAARLNADGTLDASFNYLLTFASFASAMALQADGKILVTGGFEFVNDKPKVGLARINANGEVDNSFNAIGNFASSGFSNINVITPLADGKILIGGNFTNVGGQVVNRLARLKEDGSLDTSFNVGSGTNGSVFNIKTQPDGKIIVIGLFSTINTSNRFGIARLDENGSVDAGFNPQFSQFGSLSSALAVQPDGKVLFAANVTMANGTIRRGVIRLNTNGSLDESFDTFIDSANVRSIIVQPDGKILIAGSFASVNGVSRRNVARLNADGSVDFSFATLGGVSSAVTAMLLQADGKVWIGGDFTAVSGSRRLRLARLNADGSLDDFNLDGGVAADSFFTFAPTVSALAQQADGRLVIAGFFNRVGGFERIGLARINAPRRLGSPLFDFDGDGKTDFAVYRPASGAWFNINSASGIFQGRLFGLPTDLIVPGDFDGDLKTDFAVWRPTTGQWFILQSTTNDVRVESFGANGDIPVAADFDGDGRDDLAVFRPSVGTWFLQRSRDGFAAIQFGVSGDRPQVADFDGDGRADIAVFRPSNRTWYALQSRDGFFAVAFGTAGDLPAPADFDGDGRTDPAVFRPSNGTWYLLQSQRGFAALTFGTNGDIPAVGDFDGDGKADISVFRPSNGTWYLLPSLNGGLQIQSFGADGDQPVPAAYLRGN
jgi:uncharacterized delta-60 repeat protein